MKKYTRNISLILLLTIFFLSIMVRDTICLGDRCYILIEDFEGDTNKFFKNWLLRDATREEASKIYNIRIENNNRFLHASAFSKSIQIAKKIDWDLKSYPILTWRWRVLELPEEANEEARGRNDSAASIYIVFPRKRIPFLSWKYQPCNVIKYVWSTTLPRGKVVNKEKVKFGRTIFEGRFLVLESGNDLLKTWVSEKRNVLYDYKLLFGTFPKNNPILIAILTDSNDTKGSAIADYDDIVIHKFGCISLKATFQE